MRDFSQAKFTSFDNEKQHKECALALKEIYEDLLQGIECPRRWALYHKWCSWMEIDPPRLSLKTIADQFHRHLSQTRISLKEHTLLPRIKRFDRSAAAPPLPLSIYLDGIRSAHNVGSIIRTTEAFSLGQIICGGLTPLPSHTQVAKAAMGAADWIDWRVGTIDSLPRPIIALETAEEAHPIHEFLFPERFTLALGNEEYGCSDSLLAQAECIVTIPLYGRKNSLNVANAFACAAQEIRRQRPYSQK